jgi:pilus assembly protein FimV
MSLRLNRLWLLPVLLLASQSWALGLGDIRLSSALNEPLVAEIDLLAATPEELENLTIQLSSLETFERYDLDRPLFLSGLRFRLIRSGGVEGNIVSITSDEPVTEPFITFLVEAVWTRGRLLREYTLLLDPPTFAPPPATQSTQAVTAPTRATQTDSGQIQRPPPQQAAPTPEPAPQDVVRAPSPVAETEPSAATAALDEPLPLPSEPDFDTTAPGDLVIQRGDTLWGITSRVRPDSRLTMNQTMLAIYEANPQAFSGNINIMSAGATLRIPSADEVFRISRGDALAEVQRQNAAWSGGTAEFTTQPQPALTLVPPDDDLSLFDDDAGQSVEDEAAQALIDADDARIAEIEGVLEDHQDSLIEISDNELAALRAELAELRGEEPPPPLPVEDIVDDTVIDDVDETLADDIFLDDDVDATADDDELVIGDDIVEDTAPVVEDTTPVVEEIDTPATQSLVDQILGYVNSIWGIIGGALLVAIALLVWFARRAGRGDDEDSTGVWESLEQDDIDGESLASTERLRALANQEDSAIVVVEQESALTPQLGATEEETYEATVVEDQPEQAMYTPPEEPVSEEDALMESFESTVFEEAPEPEPEAEVEADLEFTAFDEPEAAPEPTVEDIPEPVADIEHDASLDDTLHSETAINLDQADPAAEADFHMAYGLYDQAADLINGALDVDPDNEVLLAKLCEIYFVWGNMDAFVDAASRMRAVVSDDSNPEWDKIVIMGQQIASDHEMFSGVSAGAATKAVDLSFEGGEEAGELDMDFESPDIEHATSGVIDLDLGVESGQVVVTDATAEIDFDMSEQDVDVDSSRTSEMPSFDVDSPAVDTGVEDDTSEFPLAEEPSDTPTIEQQFDSFDATGEMPAAEELGSDDATEITSLEDLDEADEGGLPPDATAEIDLDDLGLDLRGLEETSIEAPEDELEDQISDFDDTAESPTINSDEGFEETGEMPDIEDLTDKNLALSDEDTDVGIDTSLLDVTGQTQVLSEDQSVDTASDVGTSLSDDDKTMLANPLEDDEVDTMVAPLGDDESTVLTSDIDFDNLGGTAALPKDAFTGTMSMDDTGEMPSLAGGTDLDLDLDDLTAALKVDDVADQPRDDETAEMPIEQSDDRSDASLDLDVGAAGLDDDDAPTQAASPEDLSGDMDNARTMTEVGTKLDLARAYVDMGDPNGARSILEEVLDEGDEGQRQQAQQILESMPS